MSSASNFLAKRADHFCTNLLNDSYTAIDCSSTPSTYCLDTALSPVQCINILNQTKYVGIEAGTLKCLVPSGNTTAGAVYCTAGYCLNSNQTCIAMQDLVDVRAKNSSMMCTDSGVIGAVECCSGYCIEAGACVPMSINSVPPRIGKENLTHLCLDKN